MNTESGYGKEAVKSGDPCIPSDIVYSIAHARERAIRKPSWYPRSRIFPRFGNFSFSPTRSP